MALSLQTTGGDVSLFAKGRAAWDAAPADPGLRPNLPFGPAELAFLGEAGRHRRAAIPTPSP
jgi:hypothetical protein